MTKNLGIGAMIGMLSGNEETVKAFNSSLGKTIASLQIDPDANGGDGALVFTFTDGTGLRLFDRGHSCCESRYMHTDDDLSYHVGATLTTADIRDGSAEEEGEWGGVKESQFLVVTTSKGTFTVVNYNEHNGYYGGILIGAETF
jgi:hypothetical protein